MQQMYFLDSNLGSFLKHSKLKDFSPLATPGISGGAKEGLGGYSPLVGEIFTFVGENLRKFEGI